MKVSVGDEETVDGQLVGFIYFFEKNPVYMQLSDLSLCVCKKLENVLSMVQMKWDKVATSTVGRLNTLSCG